MRRLHPWCVWPAITGVVYLAVPFKVPWGLAPFLLLHQTLIATSCASLAGKAHVRKPVFAAVQSKRLICLMTSLIYPPSTKLSRGNRPESLNRIGLATSLWQEKKVLWEVPCGIVQLLEGDFQHSVSVCWSSALTGYTLTKTEFIPALAAPHSGRPGLRSQRDCCVCQTVGRFLADRGLPGLNLFILWNFNHHFKFYFLIKKT